MATIMGRPSTALLAEEALVEPAQPTEQKSATEATPDWLRQLSAVAAETPTEPAEEAPTDESSDWLSRLSATVEAAPTPSDELPDWLRALRPADEAAESEGTEPLAEIEATPGEELPAWLQPMQPGVVPSTDEEEPTLEAVPDEVASLEVSVSEVVDTESAPATELPAWLSDLQPSAVATEATPPEGLPDWLRNLQPESIEIVDETKVTEVEPVEQAMASPEESVPPVSEQMRIAPEPEPPVESSAAAREVETESETVAPASEIAPPLTWWTQSAEDEGEQPIAELPEPVRMAVATARVTPVTPSAPVPPSRLTRDRSQDRSLREVRRRERSVPRRAETAPLPVVSSVNVDPLVEQLAADQYNHTVRLELARAWWSMGNRDSALDEYGKLINPAQVEDLSDEELRGA